MISFSEAQLLAWINPILWPFIRTLALFAGMPVFSQRQVPTRVRIGLALFIAVAAQPSLPAMPVIPLDSLPQLLTAVAQQLLIGLAMGFAVRVVFAALEFAGELIGLQMGLNFAGFFDPSTGSQGTSSSRFLGSMVAFLFVAINGHLMLINSLVESFQAFPVGEEPFRFLRVAQPQVWGAEIFRMGLWIALPLITMLMFVNLVLGIISRVAPQLNVFSVGFPLTVSIGLVGLVATLPLMHQPFMVALERMLAAFN
ncbi:flagellar biosynthetic protein FliR [Mitsuaria sp. TWR114]|jgi:flagellar biosynthesis protein FliR|uniref:flagellar biosynthetic protein FliR n=1 Tax=unclassified Roseateles TaxID=2626991 RepID=UPI0008ED37E7|nr:MULTISPECIES: flagellar biosynthetic protein FliR [unclassified Roseateles]MBB3280123.1 flagellar biosynthetic protein FliR [Mitsuaria sp. BK037]MBB3292171.1 flagellar biosynthetic protein FliR [Mitsuaria sp. BK041]MBB3361388.1 flagellar biosynthetic protein FliR [Mitsuaria sp. BK045]TXD91648.1 flagellar biosynthetic protein FliR [Mitsuaria sp. TWR114]SFR73583.1 flagellar biosynthetic protein FliR [Mitsuaria sp. PDC51]